MDVSNHIGSNEDIGFSILFPVPTKHLKEQITDAQAKREIDESGADGAYITINFKSPQTEFKSARDVIRHCKEPPTFHPHSKAYYWRGGQDFEYVTGKPGMFIITGDVWKDSDSKSIKAGIIFGPSLIVSRAMILGLWSGDLKDRTYHPMSGKDSTKVAQIIADNQEYWADLYSLKQPFGSIEFKTISKE